MKERPIIMSAPMVRAILEGRKTQTRRLVKGIPSDEQSTVDLIPHCGPHPCDPCLTGVWMDERTVDGEHGPALYRCPYGVVGDRLWVRETWKATGLAAFEKPRNTKHCGRFAYAADPEQLGRDALIRWRPSIHMPRWASRITLTITGVRVQRLQDITEEDAKSEGIERSKGGQWLDYESDGKGCVYSAVNGFHSLWGHINGPDTWDRNPWVWALTFTSEVRR